MNIKKTIIALITKVFSYKIIRYLFNGGILFIIDFCILYTLNKILSIDIRISQMISRTVASIIGFFTHKFLVFKDNKKKLIGFSVQGVAYTILVLVNIFLSAQILYFFVKIVKIGVLLISKIITEVIMVIETFIMLNIIFYKKKEKDKS